MMQEPWVSAMVTLSVPVLPSTVSTLDTCKAPATTRVTTSTLPPRP